MTRRTRIPCKQAPLQLAVLLVLLLICISNMNCGKYKKDANIRQQPTNVEVRFLGAARDIRGIDGPRDGTEQKSVYSVWCHQPARLLIHFPDGTTRTLTVETCQVTIDNGIVNYISAILAPGVQTYRDAVATAKTVVTDQRLEGWISPDFPHWPQDASWQVHGTVLRSSSDVTLGFFNVMVGVASRIQGGWVTFLDLTTVGDTMDAQWNFVFQTQATLRAGIEWNEPLSRQSPDATVKVALRNNLHDVAGIRIPSHVGKGFTGKCYLPALNGIAVILPDNSEIRLPADFAFFHVRKGDVRAIDIKPMTKPASFVETVEQLKQFVRALNAQSTDGVLREIQEWVADYEKNPDEAKQRKYLAEGVVTGDITFRAELKPHFVKDWFFTVIFEARAAKPKTEEDK